MQYYMIVSYVIIDVVMLLSRAQLYYQFLANLYCSCSVVYCICYIIIESIPQKYYIGDDDGVLWTGGSFQRGPRRVETVCQKALTL